MKVKTADFAQEIEIILDGYSADVRHLVNAAARDVANRCLKRIRDTSPRDTGDYAKGWTIKTVLANFYAIPTYIIHNKTDYQLVHLLEFGHAKANGGRVAEIPHVRPAAEIAERELVAAVEDALENGVA